MWSRGKGKDRSSEFYYIEEYYRLNLLLLLIPIFAWLSILADRLGRLWAILTAATLNLALWLLFLSTVEGNAESLALFLPLPWLCLALLVGLDGWQWWRARQTAVIVSENRP